MKLKLTFGIILLFTGAGSVVGIGLTLLHMWDEYKKIHAEKANIDDDRYISADVIEEFR